jgi:large subunit ribosomal protein L21
MKYAVIQLQGKQYRVAEGQTLTVDRVATEPGQTFDTSDVLLLSDGKKVSVGTPLVKGSKVTLKVLETGKDEKVVVFKYKSKSKYRKTIGHRQRISNLEVVKIV